MFASATTRPFAGLRRTFCRAGAVISAFFLAACDPAGMGQQASGPSIGPMIDPGQPVQVALLAPAGSGSANLEWLARSLKNASRR